MNAYLRNLLYVVGAVLAVALFVEAIAMGVKGAVLLAPLIAPVSSYLFYGYGVYLFLTFVGYVTVVPVLKNPREATKPIKAALLMVALSLFGVLAGISLVNAITPSFRFQPQCVKMTAFIFGAGAFAFICCTLIVQSAFRRKRA